MTPELAVLAVLQRGVFWRRQALGAGYPAREIDRLLRRGVWTRVRHGIYTAQPFDPGHVRRDRRSHLLAAEARMLALRGDTVLSHASAAVWHQIELLDAWPSEPTLTLAAPDGAERLTSHGFPIAPVLAGHRVPDSDVTTAARTVVDCTRTYGRAAGLVSAESALRRGLDPARLEAVLADCAGWPGIITARDVCAFADEFSETALESLARLWCLDQGLPAPRQQLTVRTQQGRFVGEVDFVWDEYRTVLETDGRKKYLLAASTSESDLDVRNNVVWKEKLREDDLRDRGLEVVRGYWRDGADGGKELAGRVRRAFARGLRATGERDYVLGPPTRQSARPLAEAG